MVGDVQNVARVQKHSDICLREFGALPVDMNCTKKAIHHRMSGMESDLPERYRDDFSRILTVNQCRNRLLWRST